MPQPPKRKPPLTIEEAKRRNKRLQEKRAGTAGGATAMDRAKAAGTPGGFMAAAKREKARRRGLASRNDAHVQDYYRWKNRLK